MLITQLGKSIEELQELERVEGKLKNRVKKNYLFLNNHQRLTVDELMEFECTHDLMLPAEYRDFLLKHNGGKPQLNIFSDDRVINYFFAIKTLLRDHYAIQWYMDMYQDRYPHGMLPIASAGGGDLILIGLSHDQASKIYYWNHHFEAEDHAEDYWDNITFIADSFSQFLNQLYVSNDD